MHGALRQDGADGDMTEQEPDIAAALRDFAAALPTYRTAKDVLSAVADHCTELVPVDGVGVLLAEEGNLVVATANTEEGAVIERLEAELEEGPCTECLRVGHQIVTPDLRSAVDRYPRFVPRALEAGVAGIHALPMSGPGQVVGALDMMTREPRELTRSQVAVAQMIADVGMSYLYAVQLHRGTAELADQLQQALDSRIPIEQAKGMLAERHGEDLRAAFERIRRHARSSQQKVHQVAEQVIDGRLDL